MKHVTATTDDSDLPNGSPKFQQRTKKNDNTKIEDDQSLAPE